MADRSNGNHDDVGHQEPLDNPATEAQRVYLDTLVAQAGTSAPSDDISRDEASAIIEDLKAETGIDETTDIMSDEDISLNRDK